LFDTPAGEPSNSDSSCGPSITRGVLVQMAIALKLLRSRAHKVHHSPGVGAGKAPAKQLRVLAGSLLTVNVQRPGFRLVPGLPEDSPYGTGAAGL
jgi:hypothetical protein